MAWPFQLEKAAFLLLCYAVLFLLTIPAASFGACLTPPGDPQLTCVICDRRALFLPSSWTLTILSLS